MADEDDNDETFDDDEIAEGFHATAEGAEDDELSLDDPDLDLDLELEDVEDVPEPEVDPLLPDTAPAAPVVVDDDPDDDDDDDDIEPALDEILVKTLLLADDDAPIDDDEEDQVATVSSGESDEGAVLPRQPDEFRCSSC